MLEAPRAEGIVPATAHAGTAGLSGAMARAAVPLFSVTLFLSSFLMFAVEPMIARQMLPVLGGVPMVWNGCVVFFQAVLLLGYGGAHVLTRWCASSVRLLVYAGLAVLPLVFLNLEVDAGSAGHATSAPLIWLMVALLVSVGPAFLVLAVSASVVQASLASTRHQSGRDPYFLYIASNAGSLTALVVYPTLIEPYLRLSQQARVWTIGYGVFVALVLTCAVVARVALSKTASDDRTASPAGDAGGTETVSWAQRASWCALACVPSSLMLGVTTSLTTDIAPIPLLWVVPLGLYLFTFILAFGRAGVAATALANRLLPALLLALAVVMLLRVTLPIGPALLLHLAPFFAAAMLCHGRLALGRPSPRHLTEFYFWLAFGGMVGGLFNTLAAPALFSRLVEYPIALVLVAVLRQPLATREPRDSVDVWLPVIAVAFVGSLLFVPWMVANLPIVFAGLAALASLTMMRRHRPLTFAAVIGALVLASPWMDRAKQSTVRAERTFFGTYRVIADGGLHHSLAHGTTLHGVQSLAAARRDEPLTYFHRTGPFGQMMAAIPHLREKGQVAVIGLGIGTLAAYVAPGQHWTFYEIDPAVERIARDDRYFTFLKACGSGCSVALGDARLSLAAATNARYQLITLDAFSSDAIPMHLLTNDAMAVYLSRLAPHGVLAFHITNRHLQLNTVVGRLAMANGLVALTQRDLQRRRPWPEDKAGSEWVMMARSLEDLGGLAHSPSWSLPPVSPATPLWTDDFSSLLAVLHFGRR